jgi:RNA polymerase sigma factor (sigma-70 family)
VQSAWDKAWRKLATLRDPERLRPWLLAVAANEARQLARRRRRVRLVAIEVADIGTEHADPAARPDLADLARALDRLDGDDRTLIALRYAGGFDSEAIGRTLGISAGAARSRLSRVLSRLREELNHE